MWLWLVRNKKECAESADYGGQQEALQGLTKSATVCGLYKKEILIFF